MWFALSLFAASLEFNCVVVSKSAISVKFAFRFRADCVALLTGLSASLVLSTLPNHICVGVTL